WRWLPHWSEVELYQAGREEAGVSDLQRGRVGARKLQGSLHYSPGYSPAARGHLDFLLCPQCPHRLHIYKGRVSRGHKDPRTCHRGSAEEEVSGQEYSRFQV